MAWKTCPVCKAHDTHLKKIHPVETAREACLSTHNVYREDFARAKQDIRVYEELTYALRLPLPDAVRDMINKRLNEWPYTERREGPGIDRLRNDVLNFYTQRIALLETELDRMADDNGTEAQ